MLRVIPAEVRAGQPKNLTLKRPQPNVVTQPKSNYPTADMYKQYDHRTHVYMKPDTYIGADERMIREEWLYNTQLGRMMNATIDFVPGCERLYLEILTNASDNVGRSRRAGVDPGSIDIVMDNSTISVTNYGLPIPIEIHPEEKKYVPEMIFGSLLTSSNYEVDRHEAGTNGIGAKATNIFSKRFMLIVRDHIRHLQGTWIWNDNMTRCSPPAIEPYAGKISSVQVVYTMDFARFKYEVPNGTQGGYPPEAFALFARHAIDISFTSKAKVSFNGQEFNYSNIREYARLYFGDVVDTAIIHYQWPAGTSVVNKKKGYQVSKDPAVTPEIELIAIDTPDEGHHVSFVNCMMTRDGGVHVNAAIKAVADTAVQMVNAHVIKKLTKQNKGKELDVKEKRAHTVSINDVKPHISILLAAKVLNPKFTSQTKTVLHSPVPKINIGEEELKGITHWQLIDRLHAALEAKQFANTAKTDGKLKRYVKLPKGVDANNAGKAERHKCILYITEGRSGSGYANKLMALVPGGRDYIGVLPMRGKSLNVMNADKFQIDKNHEIAELKEMLGLVDCPDENRRRTHYLDPNNFAKLRYGAIMIMADSDVDGLHIVGLILNFFHCRFPSLLARGFVMYYETPIMRVFKGKRTLKFYNQTEYNRWKADTPDYQTWKHMYYKGLGSSEDEEVKDDYTTPRVISCFYDEHAPAAIKLAFDKKLANQRKDWIGRWKPLIEEPYIQMQPISWFIDNKLILFGLAAINRAIPKLTDGLKESHRKIIYGAHKKWNIGHNKSYELNKVAQFAGFVAGNTHYQHGEQILDDVVIGMAQNFTGSNNIPWFYRKGQYGTRFEGGKDASGSRYLHTYPERLFSKILRPEDTPILVSAIEEGDEVEPETYYPVIPMILANGGSGIGLAFSTTVPNHNPLDLSQWLRMKLRGTPDDDLPDVFPWFRGFQGTIKVIDRRRKRKRTKPVNVTIINNEDGTTPQVHSVEVDDVDEDNDTNEALTVEEEEKLIEDAGSRPLLSMISYGKFTKDMNGTVVITDLPIGRWPLSYHKWLEQLVEEKKISGFRDLSADNTVYFEIYGFPEPANYHTLKLKRTIGMSNMVLLDENNQPVRYDTSYDILEAFYVRRLPVYQRRKDYILGKLTEEIDTMRHKIAFIQAVIDGEINIVNRTIAEIHGNMDRLGIPHIIYTKSKTRNLSADDIIALKDQIVQKQQEYTYIEQSTLADMWLRDLDEFDEEYRIAFGLKNPKGTITLSIKPTTFPTNETNVPGMGLREIGKQPRNPARAFRAATTPTTPSPPPQKVGLKITTVSGPTLKLATKPPSPKQETTLKLATKQNTTLKLATKQTTTLKLVPGATDRPNAIMVNQ